MICKADFLKVLWGHFNLKAVREYYAQNSLYMLCWLDCLDGIFCPYWILVYAITLSSFEEVCTAFFHKEPKQVGESVCGVQNKIGKEDKMANKVENRISYAAAYALLKKYATQNAITPEMFEKLNKLMASLYMCDPIVTTGKGKTPKKRKE